MERNESIVHLSGDEGAHAALARLMDRLKEPTAKTLFVLPAAGGPKPEYLSALFGATSASSVLLADDPEGALSETAVRIESGKLVDLDLNALNEGRESPSIIAVKIDPGDANLALSALRELSDWLRLNSKKIDLDLVTFALIRRGISLSALDAHPWQPNYERPAEQLRWKRAVRGGDGLVSTLILRPVSLQISKLATRFGITPNFLTLSSVVLALSAAVMLALGEQLWTAVAAVFMYASLVLDCSDGEVARFTGRASAVGGWLDGFTDRIKEHGLIIGLAFGAVTGEETPWVWAAVAIGAITARHIANFSFIDTVLTPVPVSIEARDLDAQALPADTSGWKQRPGLGQTSPRGWVSRVLHAPVSERWAVLALGVVLFSPKIAIISYAVYVGISLGLTGIGWILRTRALASPLHPQVRGDLVVIRDGYFDIGRGSKWVWLTAPLTVAVESGAAIILIAGATDHPSIASLGFLFAVAMSWLRYERAYGLGYGGKGRIARLGGGWLARMALSLVLLVLMQRQITAPLGAILTAGTAWLLVLVGLAAVTTYMSLRQAREVK